MKILRSNVYQEEKRISLAVSEKNKEFVIFITTIDGKVAGDAFDGVSTSYLTYFNEVPLKTRQKHFAMIKKYIENNKDL